MKFLRSIFYILLFVVFVSPSRAQPQPGQGWSGISTRKDLWNTYVSPGVRLGYVFGEGFSWSTEITLGLIRGFDGRFYSIALGHQKIPNNPTSFNYVAVQGGSVLGLSVGRAFYKDKGGARQKGWRLSGFGGLVWGFVSYEKLIFPSLSAKYQTIGVWGKFPIPLALFNKEIGWVEF